MIHNFKSISISFQNTPLEIRELVTLEEKLCKQLILSMKEMTDATEILVLSTCNRTEVYYASDQDLHAEIIKLIGIQKGLINIFQYKEYFSLINDHHLAIRHLYDVSIGLESQVVGDIQIINQVKTAYQWSADTNAAGPFLHRLMHTIFFTNKKVVQETPFRDGAASISYATAELAESLISEIAEPKILIIGLGEMGADVCRNLSASGPKNITVANRTLSKAVELSTTCKISIIPFDDIWSAIREADVIISSISRDEPIILKKQVEALTILSYKYFIDISVPRSIEASVEDVPGVLVYNIDHITSKASRALEKRIQAIPDVKAIISNSIAEFNDWSKEMIVSPTINKLKNALEQIRQEEISRYLKHLNESEAEKVEAITRNIMQKIMKLPVLQLKAACKRGEAETLIDVLNDLFDLEKQSHEFKEIK
jgi:glutamyl-tRNA reductase